MLRVNEIVDSTTACDEVLSLPYEQRQKSRQRARLDSGLEVSLVLPRGTVLRHGDCLRSKDGRLIEVQAQAEAVSSVCADDTLLLMRAAYHLGNRHVPLQIAATALYYRQDHVLDAMLTQLGLTVVHQTAPFEPEGGAYGGGHGHH